MVKRVNDMTKCKKCKVEMKYEWSDADDLGGVEEWLECPKCGKTCDVPKKS